MPPLAESGNSLNSEGRLPTLQKKPAIRDGRQVREENRRKVTVQEIRPIRSRNMCPKSHNAAKAPLSPRFLSIANRRCSLHCQKLVEPSRLRAIAFVRSSCYLNPSHACIEAKLAELGKFAKLTEYLDAIGDAKATACEMKTRDYKNEMRFLPYEFLRGKEIKLFDFRAFNDCILSK